MIKAIREKKPLILAILAVLCCLFIAFPVLAEGDGSGGGKDIPLALASSSPANGQSNVPVTANINLTFNKNVVNLAVKDNNMKCFSLSSYGISVPIQVIMPDDQVDFEHRRNIEINPLQDLKPGTLYKLVISGQLQAKNGMSLGSPVTVSFTTAGAAASQNTNTGQNTGSVKSGSAQTTQQTTATEKVTTEKAAKENAKTAAENTKEKANTEAKAKSEEKENKSTNTKGIAVAAGLAIIAAGVYGYYRYSHK